MPAGVSEAEADAIVQDPTSDSFYFDTWIQRAMANEQIFEEVCSQGRAVKAVQRWLGTIVSPSGARSGPITLPACATLEDRDTIAFSSGAGCQLMTLRTRVTWGSNFAEFARFQTIVCENLSKFWACFDRCFSRYRPTKC